MDLMFRVGEINPPTELPSTCTATSNQYTVPAAWATCRPHHRLPFSHKRQQRGHPDTRAGRHTHTVALQMAVGCRQVIECRLRTDKHPHPTPGGWALGMLNPQLIRHRPANRYAQQHWPRLPRWPVAAYACQIPPERQMTEAAHEPARITVPPSTPSAHTTGGPAAIRTTEAQQPPAVEPTNHPTRMQRPFLPDGGR